MHAWLAKSIDWCVIQLAARHAVRIEPAPGPEPEAEGGIKLRDGWPGHSGLRLEHWSLGADGSFQFASPVNTAAPENNTVFGRFYPADKAWQTRPTVVLLHGWNADFCYRRLFPRLAARLNRVQVNTVMIELPYHMQRRPHYGPVRDFISSNVPRMLEATQQAVAETRALVRWLREQGSPAVGLWGISLGGWLAGLAAQLEPCLGFVVLMTPIARIDRVIAELPFCEPVRRGLGQHALDFQSLNLAAAKPVLDPEHILIVESRHDLFAPPDTLEELWRAWDQPEIWRFRHGHISLLMSRPIMARTIEWVARQGR